MTRGRPEPIELIDDVHVTLIPSGQKFVLHRGERVTVTQALGGSITVHTDAGHLARIDGADAVALGLGDLIEDRGDSSAGTAVTVARRTAGSPRPTRPTSPTSPTSTRSAASSTSATGTTGDGGEFDMALVMRQLETVFDPEIPVNVVDLGLIYSCEAAKQPDGRYRVKIEMSMTAPGCGMGDVLKIDARDRVAALPGVGEVDVVIVWDPPWGIDRMSDAARLQLGML